MHYLATGHPYWNAVRLTAAATAAAAIAAALTMVVAGWVGWSASKIARQQALISSTDLLRTTYTNFFDDPEMRQTRRRFIESYRSETINPAAARRILNYFEDIGQYGQHGLVDTATVYDLLGTWMMNYWYACEDWVEQQRVGQREAWSGQEAMVGKFHGIAKRGDPWRKRPRKPDGHWWEREPNVPDEFWSPFSREQILDFFEMELQELDSYATGKGQSQSAPDGPGGVGD
jgi:hypothetical protein